MGLKDFLNKTGLVSFEEETKKEDSKQNIPSKENTTIVSTTPVREIITNPASSSLRETFKNLIKDKNLPGPDYYEFIIMKEAMNGILIPETKYQSAFAGLAAQGLTLDKLIESANLYKTFIQEEMDAFKQAYQVHYKQNVTDKENELKAKSEEMKQLAERITQLNKEISDISVDIASNKQQLDMKNNEFQGAGQLAMGEIDQEINNIQLYIKQ